MDGLAVLKRWRKRPGQLSPSSGDAVKPKDTLMHHSRLCAVLIDCKTADVDEAANFWAAALGRPVDRNYPMSRVLFIFNSSTSSNDIRRIEATVRPIRAVEGRGPKAAPTKIPTREKFTKSLIGGKLPNRPRAGAAKLFVLTNAEKFRGPQTIAQNSMESF
jgi:hypothetical protein